MSSDNHIFFFFGKMKDKRIILTYFHIFNHQEKDKKKKKNRLAQSYLHIGIYECTVSNSNGNMKQLERKNPCKKLMFQ